MVGTWEPDLMTLFGDFDSLRGRLWLPKLENGPLKTNAVPVLVRNARFFASKIGNAIFFSILQWPWAVRSFDPAAGA